MAEDSNAATDVFMRDRTDATTTRVSTDSAGVQANGGSSSVASISAGGRFVAFDSSATNLVAGDTNGVGDVFTKEFRAEPAATTPPAEPVPAPGAPAAPARDTTKPVIAACGGKQGGHACAGDLPV